jgi:hypothetical protein
MRFPGFIGPSYTLRTVNVDCQRCINLYPELVESGKGKEGEVAVLLSTPGLLLKVTIGAGPIRGTYTASNGQLFVVSNTKIYRVSGAWVATELGTLNSNSGHVSMADNGISLVAVDGTDGYVVTLSSGAFAEITDPDFLGADQVTYQDGYFIFNKPDSGQFYITELNSTNIDALDIATSEGSPDNIVAILSENRNLWLFNERTTEVFFNSGNADFPFERIQGAFIEQGCAAPFSVAKIANSVLWLGRNEFGQGVVYMAQGYQPKRISTHAVEQEIQSYGDISDANAYVYQENGHDFYVLNFTNADTTWVYDFSTNMWHERVYTNQGAFERHRANYHAFAHSTHVVGDYENGKLYALSSSTYSDNGSEITRRRTAPHLSAGLKRVQFNSFQLDIESGVGLDGATTTQGNDPQAMMRFSDDGGHTWSNEKWTSFGKIGQTKRRALWRRLGTSRDRVYEITITDPVPVTLIGAEVDAVPGGS